MNKVNLLLVDDVPNNLFALSAVLDHADYNLVTASSGKQALEHLAQQEFAVVLLDVMMPEMDGFEVATRMKKDESMRFVPILFVTAIARDVKEIYRGYSIGGVDYILKPLDPEVVRGKVSVFVELFRQKKEIQRQAELIRSSERAQFLVWERAARHKAETAERKFRNLVNALDHAIIWEGSTDLSRLTFISERVEGILGYAREKWLQEPSFFLDHVFPEDRPKLLKSIESLLNKQKTILGERCEHRMVSADGSVRWFHTGFQEDREPDGRISKLRGLCVEISPLKKVEEYLRQSIQAKDEIVSVVAHDLKTPLTAADLGSSLLKLATDKGDLTAAKRQVLQVKHAIKHTIRLADNILDAEKIKAGNFNIETKTENAAEIVKEAIEMLTPIAEEKSIKFNIEVDSTSFIDCDRQRILQVLSNLIGNAIKFSSPRSEIWVKGERQGASFFFSVKDHGPGIPKKQIQFVFRRFWQASPVRRAGLGLGLTISKGIIEAHGGKIWVESKEGEGSVFYFSLPIEPSARVGP